MGKYFNTQRGPLAVSLASGKAVTAPPKSWIEIDPADEGSAALQSMIRKGYLKRSALPDPAPVEAPAPAPAPEAKPAVGKNLADFEKSLPPLPPSEEKDSAATASKPFSAGDKKKF